MGAWGTGILENDNALDILEHMMVADDKSLRGMIALALQSKYHAVQDLAAAVIDAIYNGRDERVIPKGSLHEEWFEALKDRNVLTDDYRFLFEGYKNTASSNIAWGMSHPQTSWNTPKLHQEHEKVLLHLKENLDRVPSAFEEMMKEQENE